jgi:hypothetical protein
MVMLHTGQHWQLFIFKTEITVIHLKI